LVELLRAIATKACFDALAKVPVVVPIAPAVANPPECASNPPPPPRAVCVPAILLVNDERFALVALTQVLLAPSKELAQTRKTRQSLVVVVAPAIEIATVAVLCTPPAITSHGFPDVTTPVKVAIWAMMWSPGSAMTTFAIVADVARFQKTSRQTALVAPAVPVCQGDPVTLANPEGVLSVTPTSSVCTKRSATSLVA
jgi:hypothetical protein